MNLLAPRANGAIAKCVSSETESLNGRVLHVTPPTALACREAGSVNKMRRRHSPAHGWNPRSDRELRRGDTPMPERDRHANRIADPAAPDDREPGTVAGYRLLRKIGEGGMSAVYQSYDVAAGRPVALKLLAEHLAGQPEFVGRFYRESRLSRVLEHPNIVQGHASGFDSDVKKHYLVMELIDGPSAHGALAAQGPLPVGAVARIGIDIAQALEFLHDRQYVHRDVKPDNILLHPDGVAKLADLGLAKRLNEDSQLTAVHQGVGTSYYMPYEQAVNANLVDGRSDIFALGATLYHLLTGEVPFAGTTHDEVVREKWQDSFRPIRELSPGVPVALAELIERTLACDPRERIQRAGQLAKALAATKLATRLPSFAGGDLPLGAGDSARTDTPTRTDHRITSPPQAPRPPGTPPPGEGFTGGNSGTTFPRCSPPPGWPW
jgi:serine/threonine-protein kinase